jgi:hypothetical protein
MSEPDPRAEVLRAAGHSEAADLLDALGALTAQPEPETPEEQPEQPPADPRQAEGAALLAALKRDVGDGGWSSSVPAS